MKESLDLARLQLRVQRMSIYRGVLRQAVPAAICRALEQPCLSTVTDIFTAAAQSGFPGCPGDAVADGVLYDDNMFTRALSRGQEAFLPAGIREAARFDLDTLEYLASLRCEDFGLSGEILPPSWESYKATTPLSDRWSGRIKELGDFYASNGVGMFARHRAFIWSQTLTPVKNPDPIRFSDLKGYAHERAIVTANILRFVKGGPANHLLLYGDKGTGKSATVHSLVNEYGHMGLRLIELSKNSLVTLPALAEQIKDIPLRFLLFVDDLSFSDSDDQFTALKAVLEGSIETTPENCLICATSNRRHFIREGQSQRAGDDLHREDTLQEQQSLSDRFGLTVTFLRPRREEYLEIVEALAKDRGMLIPREQLFAAAEQWALAKGGRSPRTAVQFLRSFGQIEDEGKESR